MYLSVAKKQSFAVMFFLLVVIILVAGAAITTGGKMEIKNASGIVSVNSSGRGVLEYHWQKVPFKPYIKKLCTPDGINLLLDAPSDHLHHHGLMFAVNADGVNFWEETSSAGKQLQKNISTLNSSTVDNDSKAFFSGRLDWISPSDDKLALIERRSIQVDMTEALDATLLTWRSEFKIPQEGTDSLEISGAHYHGLGMRFIRSMDGAGPFFNADGKEGEVFRGDEKLVRSKWCAYTAKAEGKIVTVAMFDHPANPRYPALWFTMTKPFAYLSATIGLHKEPLQITKEKPVSFCYGVALWDGIVDKDTIENAYNKWIAIQKTVDKKKNIEETNDGNGQK